jgi:hypothetical protein
VISRGSGPLPDPFCHPLLNNGFQVGQVIAPDGLCQKSPGRSDLFRQNVDEPKNGDANDRRDDDRDPRDAVGDGIQRFSMEHGGVRGLRKQRRAEQDEQDEEERRSPAAPRARCQNGWSWCLHDLGGQLKPSDSSGDCCEGKASSAVNR